MPAQEGPNWGTLVPRFLLGLVFLHAGGMKLFGLFGAPPGMIDKLTEMITGWGWPAPTLLAYAAAITEFFGGACVLIGLFTRFWALGLAATMAVAAIKVHWAEGFGGWGYNVVLGILALSLVVQGGGAFSLDRMILRPAPPAPKKPA